MSLAASIFCTCIISTSGKSSQTKNHDGPEFSPDHPAHKAILATQLENSSTAAKVMMSVGGCFERTTRLELPLGVCARSVLELVVNVWWRSWSWFACDAKKKWRKAIDPKHAKPFPALLGPTRPSG
jgi:hypothetical protein